MKRKKAAPVEAEFDLIIADWKDTEALLVGIKGALKRRGLVLQAWDIGTDDTVVTIDVRKAAARAVSVELNMGEELQSGDFVAVEQKLQ